jgi:hypothetical protein
MNDGLSSGCPLPSRNLSRRLVAAGRLSAAIAVLALGGAGCGSSGSSFGSGGASVTPGSGGNSSPVTSPSSGTGGSGPGASGGSGDISPAGSGGGVAASGGSGTGVDPAGSGGSSGPDTGPGGGSATGGRGATGSGGGGVVSGSGGRGPGGSGTGGVVVSTGGAGPVTGAGGGGTTDGPPCPKPAGQICHEFVANDNSSNYRVNYVNEFTSTAPGGIVWTSPVPGVANGSNNSPRTLEIVDNPQAKNGKALLVSIEQGYVELDMADGKRLVTVTNFSGISGACRITEDGTTALANDSRVIIAGASPNTGTTVRTFNIPAGANLRAINRNPVTKNFWLTKTEVIYEVSPTGQTVWSANMPTGSKGYSVWWRDGGGAYATTGDPSTVVEIDASKTIVSTVGDKTKFPGILDFFSGFVRLPNGDYVVANWLGHLGSATGEYATHQVVEFSLDNKIVWSWGSATLARQITNVLVIR